jgi:hypothetical protein
MLGPLAAAAETVASNWSRPTANESTDAQRAARLLQAIDDELAGNTLLKQGGFADWMTRADETLRRAGRDGGA